MSREIKFRAFDTNYKVIFYHHSALIKLDGRIYNNLRDYGEDIHSNSIILMKYTGLKDKNGIEIFEGDIIKTYWQHCGITNYDYELTGIIRWSDYYSGFVITVNENNKEWDVVLYSFEREEINHDETEVIGNIYQNPQLLDKP